MKMINMNKITLVAAMIGVAATTLSLSGCSSNESTDVTVDRPSAMEDREIIEGIAKQIADNVDEKAKKESDDIKLPDYP